MAYNCCPRFDKELLELNHDNNETKILQNKN